MRIFVVLLFVSFKVFGLELNHQIDFLTKQQKNDNFSGIKYNLKGNHFMDDDLIAFHVKTQQTNKNKHDFTDVTEFYWDRTSDDYSVKIGVDKEFWGKAELINVVDVINQKNNLGLETKEKLGELMAKFSHFKEDDVYSFYYLPYFREQEFSDMTVANTSFEHKKSSFALRYASVIDNIDFGLSYFNGVDKNPEFSPNGSKFDVYYPNLKQFGVDAQLTLENILWKLEFAKKYYQGKNHHSSVYGFEYLLGTQWDIGILFESMQDTDSNLFADDVMLGLRIALNDEDSSSGLIALNYDREHHSKMLNVSLEKRFGDDIKLSIKSQSLFDKEDDTFLTNRNNNTSATLAYYF